MALSKETRDWWAGVVESWKHDPAYRNDNFGWMAEHVFAVDAELSRLPALEALAVASRRKLEAWKTYTASKFETPEEIDRLSQAVRATDGEWRAALAAVYPELKEASG